MKDWLLKWELLGRPGTFARPMSAAMLLAAPEAIFSRLSSSSEGGDFITPTHYTNSGHGVGFYATTGYIFSYREEGKSLWEVSVGFQPWWRQQNRLPTYVCESLDEAKKTLQQKGPVGSARLENPYP